MSPSNAILFLLSLSFHPSILFARTIQLPVGIFGEGVTHVQGSIFLVSDIISGDVHLIDTRTDITARIIRAPPNRSAFGLDVDQASRVYVAGVGPGFADFAAQVLGLDFSNITASLHVYDIPTGSQVASCLVPDAGFINDVIVDGEFAYFTDSVRPFLYTLEIGKLPECAVKRVGLDERFFAGNSFRANGIVTFRGGLIVSNTELGSLYFVDLKRSAIVTELTPQGTIPGVGGLAIRNIEDFPLLFASLELSDEVVVFRLAFTPKQRVVTLTRITNITSSSFNIPSTVAVSADLLLVPNLNGTARTLGDPFSVSVLRLDDVLSL